MSWGWFEHVAKAEMAEQIREANAARLARASSRRQAHRSAWRSAVLFLAAWLDGAAHSLARASAALADLAAASEPSAARGRE